MKTLLLMLSLVTVSYAQECKTTKSKDIVLEKLELKTDVPKWLEGATIIVRLADGKESSVPAEKFKVVPRKQQFIVTRMLHETELMCSSPRNKNRVSVMGGLGPSGNLKATTSGTTVSIETGPAAVGGLSYQRLLTDELSVGGQVQTNHTILMQLGWDF